jgi:hypothetical protein
VDRKILITLILSLLFVFLAGCGSYTKEGDSIQKSNHVSDASDLKLCSANSDGVCPAGCSGLNDVDCCPEGYFYLNAPNNRSGCYSTNVNKGTCSANQDCLKSAADGCCPAWCNIFADRDCCEIDGYRWEDESCNTWFDKEQTTSPLIDFDEAKANRAFTFKNCQTLVNKTVNFNGTVMYQDCNKNCIGGCPSVGNRYCYYGIRDNNGCMVYLRNKVHLYSPNSSPHPDKIYNRYQFGDSVSITDEISVFFNHYCGYSQEKVPECSYFILGQT